MEDPAPSNTRIAGGIERLLARRIGDPCLGYDTALAALASTFDGVDAGQLLDRLDDAARAMFGAGDDLHLQADAIADALFDRLGLRVALDDYRALTLGRALASHRAQPLLLAVVGHELARRAGFRSLVARGGEDYWTILTQDDQFLPIGYTKPPDEQTVAQLRACCAHEISYAVLQAMSEQAPADVALLAVRVRALLPLRAHTEHEEEGGI